MTWARVVRVLMGLIWPWRGALGLTFVFGVGRVLAYVGVGICSALTIFALKNGTPFEGYLWALAALAPLALARLQLRLLAPGPLPPGLEARLAAAAARLDAVRLAARAGPLLSPAQRQEYPPFFSLEKNAL